MYKPILTNQNAMRKFGNNRLIEYSPKLNRRVILFSNLEYYHYLITEFDASLHSFCEQAPEIKGIHKGTEHSSIFDMVKIDKNQKHIFVEVKYEKDLYLEKVKKQVSIQRNWCFERNYEHQIFTDRNLIGKELFLSNLMQMRSILVHHEVDNILASQIVDIIQFNKKITVEKIIEILEVDSQRVFVQLVHLYHRGMISLNVDEAIYSKSTEVTSGQIKN